MKNGSGTPLTLCRIGMMLVTRTRVRARMPKFAQTGLSVPLWGGARKGFVGHGGFSFGEYLREGAVPRLLRPSLRQLQTCRSSRGGGKNTPTTHS